MYHIKHNLYKCPVDMIYDQTIASPIDYTKSWKYIEQNKMNIQNVHYDQIIASPVDYTHVQYIGQNRITRFLFWNICWFYFNNSKTL